MLKGALAGMPTRPVLYIALPVLLLGLGYHLFTTYQSCRTHAELRESLHAAIKASADGGDPGPVRFADITDFVWERADILVNYKPSGASTDCPFDWDWSQEKRDELIARDLLTVIVFIADNKLINYLEYSRDRADFVGVKNPYTPETAIFSVSPSPDGSYKYILSPIE